MKLFIEIPEDTYTATRNESMSHSDVKNVVEAIKSGTSIPDGATNGDIVMAMFPYAFKSIYVESDECMTDYVTIYLGDYEMRVTWDWWWGSYKKEV